MDVQAFLKRFDTRRIYHYGSDGILHRRTEQNADLEHELPVKGGSVRVGVYPGFFEIEPVAAKKSPESYWRLVTFPDVDGLTQDGIGFGSKSGWSQSALDALGIVASVGGGLLGFIVGGSIV